MDHQSIFRKGRGRPLGNPGMATSRGTYRLPRASVANTPQEALPAQPRVPAVRQGQGCPLLLSPSRPCSPHSPLSSPCHPHHIFPPVTPQRAATAPLVPPALKHPMPTAELLGVRLAQNGFIKKIALFSPGIVGGAQGADASSLNEISVIFTVYFNCFN